MTERESVGSIEVDPNPTIPLQTTGDEIILTLIKELTQTTIETAIVEIEVTNDVLASPGSDGSETRNSIVDEVISEAISILASSLITLTSLQVTEIGMLDIRLLIVPLH